MMLLDTCVLIWNAIEPSKLTPKAKKALKHSANELMICDISIWEIAMLIKKNRLTVDESASGFTNLLLQSSNFHIQQITPGIAELSVNIRSEINNDPADRLIAATSILKNTHHYRRSKSQDCSSYSMHVPKRSGIRFSLRDHTMRVHKFITLTYLTF